MDDAVLVALIGAVFTAGGVFVGHVVGVYKTRRETQVKEIEVERATQIKELEVKRGQVADAVDAANALRDDMLDQIKELSTQLRTAHSRMDELGKTIDLQRVEIMKMSKDVIECERRGVEQADTFVRFKAGLIMAGVKLPLDVVAPPAPPATAAHSGP